MANKSFNKEAEFEYLGFSFKPIKFLTPTERDNLLRSVHGIGVSNYSDNPPQSFRSGTYNYETFYQAARSAQADAEVFLFNGKGLVVPCENALFAINKEEAEKINIPRKLFKTILQVEILSEEPLPSELSLHDVAHQITDGPCSGIIKTVMHNEHLNKNESVTEVKKHGTSLEFFQMNDQGYQLDED